MGQRGKDPKDQISVRILQTMVSEVPLILGLLEPERRILMLFGLKLQEGEN